MARVEAGESAGAKPEGSPGGGFAQLVIRPKRVRWAAWIAAVVLLGVMTTVAVLLRGRRHRGVTSAPPTRWPWCCSAADGARILTLTLARVRADADGVEVRNLVITRWLPGRRCSR